jgi:hypothetical protein
MIFLKGHLSHFPNKCGLKYISFVWGLAPVGGGGYKERRI